MATAQDMLFVSTVEGRLYALGKHKGKAIQIQQARTPLEKVDAATETKARSILKQTKIENGYALVLGATDGKLIESLIAKSQLHFLVIESNNKKVAQLRQRWERAGYYGSRVVIRHGNTATFSPPPYFVNLILCEDPNAAGFAGKLTALSSKLNALRPFGAPPLPPAQQAKHQPFLS